MLKNTVNNGRFEIGFDIDYDPITQSESKLDPGDHFSDRYADSIDQRGQTKDIKFLWNRWITEIAHCDTVHLLYLLQIACDLHRQWVIERNQYFASISRTDRFIEHVDGPRLITNLLKWHIEDKERNQWNGALMEWSEISGLSLSIDQLVAHGMTNCMLLNFW